MVDLSSLQAAIGGLKAASDIAKALVTLRDAGLIQHKTIELQATILAAQASALDAQSQQFALVDAIRDLERELAEAKAWEAEKQRYDLHEVAPGAFVYRIKESVRGAGPDHQLCANCYNAHAAKAILQQEVRVPGMAQVLLCHSCGAEIYVVGQRDPRHASPARKQLNSR